MIKDRRVMFYLKMAQNNAKRTPAEQRAFLTHLTPEDRTWVRKAQEGIDEKKAGGKTS